MLGDPNGIKKMEIDIIIETIIRALLIRSLADFFSISKISISLPSGAIPSDASFLIISFTIFF